MDLIRSNENEQYKNVLCGFLVLGLVCVAGCQKKKGTGGGSGGEPIVIDGSDTMVNLSQAWAEAYHKKHPGVSIQVSGGGSGVGINSLIAGKVHMANSSRRMEEKELAKAKANNPGKEPVEHIVGIDALAIYVHKDNPIETIGMEELAEICDGGKITMWSQLGIKSAGNNEITRVSRHSHKSHPGS
jgi:phosphate transport system substrate-binding protein